MTFLAELGRHDDREPLDRLDGGLIALGVGVGREVLQIAEDKRHLDGTGKHPLFRPPLGLTNSRLRQLVLHSTAMDPQQHWIRKGQQLTERLVHCG